MALGFGLHVGGGLIHLLLVVALVVPVINLLSGRRTVVWSQVAPAQARKESSVAWRPPHRIEPSQHLI